MNNTSKISQESTNHEARIIQINDHVLGFYYGRGLTGKSGYESNPENWINKGAWDLGIASYAVYRGDSALIFDSSTSPECGLWIRRYLDEKLGIKDIIVVLSHWHLDHIAGLSAFKDCQIYALEATAECLRQNRVAIETGNLWGPPGIPVIMPTQTFSDSLDINIGDIAIQFRHYRIHSHDGLAMLICSDRALYAGDMLEDPISYIVEPGDIPTHLKELSHLQQLSFASIFPSHGSFEIIANGGYEKSLIAAIIEYNRNMLRHVHDNDYLNLTIENMIPQALKTGAVSIWESYRSVHRDNLHRVYEHWHVF
ncbi:MAG: MBL fold metallo-hydrolase [Candidatus Riflebacteria bacterium HGW-Riflebacteria-2]|jgi:glyoxylase-like metal-dependent hydrolase (beta-lactamase superfamily II)|nr:MAG: MBL fold metallo-hydrolase [Candidatus Riflebacteria bacterium HGW-Riflebacteria-2]